MILLYLCSIVALIGCAVVLTLDWYPIPDGLYKLLDGFVAPVLIVLAWVLFIAAIIVVLI